MDRCCFIPCTYIQYTVCMYVCRLCLNILYKTYRNKECGYVNERGSKHLANFAIFESCWFDSLKEVVTGEKEPQPRLNSGLFSFSYVRRSALIPFTILCIPSSHHAMYIQYIRTCVRAHDQMWAAMLPPLRTQTVRLNCWMAACMLTKKLI